jgi:hypothetical protein
MKLLVFIFWCLFILFGSFILLTFLFQLINWKQKVTTDVSRTWAFIFSIFIVSIFGLVVKDMITYTYGQDCSPIFGIPTGPLGPAYGAAYCQIALDSTLIILFGISWIVLHVFLLTLIS